MPRTQNTLLCAVDAPLVCTVKTIYIRRGYEISQLYLDVNVADQMIAQVVTDIHLLDFAILQRTQPRQRATQGNAT